MDPYPQLSLSTNGPLTHHKKRKKTKVKGVVKKNNNNRGLGDKGGHSQCLFLGLSH